MFDTEKIKYLIRSNGFEIIEFIRKIKMTNSSFYSMINNQTDPKLSSIKKIADKLNVGIDDLLIRK